MEPDDAIEQWRQVVGWPEYEVSNYGRVKRVSPATGTAAGKILNAWKKPNNYLAVGLSRKSVVTTKLIHRLVAEAWIGPADGLDVCHNDGDRSNNVLSNLRIDTRKGNMQDIYKHDTHIRGERCGTNKYSESLIKQIKSEIKDGAVLRQLAMKYGIPSPTVYGIAAGRIWRWL
jgi:hypothetical protein